MKTELRNPKNGIFMQPNPRSPFYARKRSKSGNNFNAIKIKNVDKTKIFEKLLCNIHIFNYFCK